MEVPLGKFAVLIACSPMRNPTRWCIPPKSTFGKAWANSSWTFGISNRRMCFKRNDPETNTYDTADRLTDVVNKKSGGELISSYHYDLDANGNRTKVTETTSQGTQITQYQYDELNRLKQTTYPDSKVVSYTYDELGNRLTKVEAGVTTTYKYDEANRLIRTDSPSGKEIFMYDKRGNLIKRITPQKKTIAYEFDYENRLTRYQDDIHVVEYEYNADGVRLSKTVDGTKMRFINDVHTPLTQVLMETTANWGILARYIYGGQGFDELISQERW